MTTHMERHNGPSNLDEFRRLCEKLFRNEETGEIYEVDANRVEEIYAALFDSSSFGRDEIDFHWKKWIGVIEKPVSALVIVDVQNDFVDGSLNLMQCPAGHNGNDVLDPINRLAETTKFDLVVCTLDWHPEDHISFFDNVQKRKFHSSCTIRQEKVAMFDTVVFEGEPPVRQKLWPRHAVQNSWGSQLHEKLKVGDCVKVFKGTDSKIDSYSAFFDNERLRMTDLDAVLRKHHVTDVYICGLAFDVCVGLTTMDSLSLGYRTVLVEDCTRCIDLQGAAGMKKRILEESGCVVDSKCVKAMTEGRDKRFELAYKLAMELAKKNHPPNHD